MAWCSNCNWDGEDYVDKWSSEKKESVVKCCPNCDYPVGAQTRESYERDGKPLNLEVHEDKETTPNQIKASFLNCLLCNGIINLFQYKLAQQEIYNPMVARLNNDGSIEWVRKGIT